MAADTQESDGTSGMFTRCDKIFRKSVVTRPGGRKHHDVLIGTSGETFSGMLFVDWFPGVAVLEAIGAERPALPHSLTSFGEHNDFYCIILEPSGVFVCTPQLRPIRLEGRFFAIGSGAKLALAAMEMGASARRAVEIACKYDLYSRPPIRSATL